MCSSLRFTSSFPPSLLPPSPPHRTTLCYAHKHNALLSLDLRKTLAAIHSSSIIACLHAQSGEVAMEAAKAAINGGISVLEITMTTPDVFEVLYMIRFLEFLKSCIVVFEVLRGLVQQFPSTILGVGTVLNGLDAKTAIDAGAKFLMSPATVKDILDDLRGSEVLYIPGVMTPTEVLTAYNAGAKIVKVYPVSVLGSLQYISALKKPFSHIPMIVSQGITLDSMESYIRGGASAVVLSDAIFEIEAMNKRNYGRISELASQAVGKGEKIKQGGST